MKLIIGFITYNDTTAKYLPFFLPSLKAALVRAFGEYAPEQNYRLLAVDNSDQEANANSKYLQANFPEIDLSFAGTNLGFAKAYNRMIRRAFEFSAEYFLMLNPDMFLAPDAIVKLISALDAERSLGAVAPRILQWDFVNNTPTKIIDSDGLFITASYSFSDRHQGLEAFALAPEMVFGFTGAAALIRMKALQDVAYQGREYLDELMFMYKEDVDLSYRLQLANWPIKLIPSALIYHDRTASPAGANWFRVAFNRKNKSRQVKRWSFLNQWILVLKYSGLRYSGRVKFRTWVYQLASLAFAAIFESYLILELRRLGKIRAEIRAKRQSLKIVINPSKIEEMMGK
jgi:GT2 family glycosyltransferase